jgi:hypothetical protein
MEIDRYSDTHMNAHNGIWFYPELIEFYNTMGQDSVFITFDVDWAPEHVLSRTLNWLDANEISATFFATHGSVILKSAVNSSRFEVAIHPNFSKEGSPDSHIQDLLREFPSALGSRNHRNFSGRNFSDALRQNGLLYDVSKILWSQPYCQCLPMYNGLIEAAYSWEDGTHLELGLSLDITQVPVHQPGLHIMAFHPVLFDLNCRSYKELKSFTSNYHQLTSIPEEEFKASRNNGYGIGEFSRQFLLDLKAKDVKFHLLSEIMRPAYAIESRRKRFPLIERNDR